MLIAAMLATGGAEAAAASAVGASAATAVARATATIRRPVVLKGDAVATPEIDTPPRPQRARPCSGASSGGDGPAPGCRLIVYDLP